MVLMEVHRQSPHGGNVGTASIFTEHVRALERGVPLAADHFASLWRALRAVLVSELRKRSLWNASPAYLGVYGGVSWSRHEVLEELMVECYTAAFLHRLRSLHAQLRTRPSIDGLIFLNVRHFLHDTQKKHDPLGFRVFTVLRAAVRGLVRDGTLYLVAGDDEIRKDTVVGFGSANQGEGAGTTEFGTTELGTTELEDRARILGDALLPDLVTAQGKAQVKLIERLAAHLAGWRQQGVPTFRFQNLCTALSNDTRGRWASIWQQEEGPMASEPQGGEFAALVRQVQPDSGFAERQSFRQLLVCVEATLDRMRRDEDEITHNGLRRLWLFLRNHAVGDSDRGADGALPSRRKMAALLGIPRDRLGTLHITLGRLVDGCKGE